MCDAQAGCLLPSLQTQVAPNWDACRGVGVMSVRSILTFLLVFCGVVAVAVPVSMSRFKWSASGATAEQRGIGSDGSIALPQHPASAIACTGPAKSTASHATLQDIADHARALTQEQRGAEALSRYDDLQQLDPGYPGLYLDRATALLAAQRYDDALKAVDLQIGISQCLARLPAAAVESYCQREMPRHTPDECRAEIKAVERTSHFQAAIAQMQLGRGDAPTSEAMQTGSPASMLPAGGPAEVSQLPKRVSEKPVRRTTSASRPLRESDALVSAKGTDTALGAFSR